MEDYACLSAIYPAFKVSLNGIKLWILSSHTHQIYCIESHRNVIVQWLWVVD